MPSENIDFCMATVKQMLGLARIVIEAARAVVVVEVEEWLLVVTVVGDWRFFFNGVDG